MSIHPTATVSPKAELGADVEIGPNAIIEAGVTIGDRCRIGPMVHIQGTTTLGPENVIHNCATIGFPPQFLGFKGAPTLCRIGARNVFREYVSIHRSIYEDGQATVIGDDCFLMGSVHIGHDVTLGSGIVMVNGSMIAGHTVVGDKTFISGNSAVHQFVRIGRNVMLGGLCRLTRDAPPFCILTGYTARVHGLNAVGLRRAGFGPAVRAELKRLLHAIYRTDVTREQALAAIELEGLTAEGRELMEFFLAPSKRGIVPMGSGEGDEE